MDVAHLNNKTVITKQKLIVSWQLVAAKIARFELYICVANSILLFIYPCCICDGILLIIRRPLDFYCQLLRGQVSKCRKIQKQIPREKEWRLHTFRVAPVDFENDRVLCLWYQKERLNLPREKKFSCKRPSALISERSVHPKPVGVANQCRFSAKRAASN